jgi:hypothetical protein
MTRRPTDEDLIAENDNQLTVVEWQAIRALERLAKTWPRTLKLVSMGSGLHVIHADDARFDGDNTPAVRGQSILATIAGMPNGGGDW